MSLSTDDRCPHCGAPYMSSMAPGEKPESRYCYTCSTMTTTAKQKLAAPDTIDDLDLQPLEGGSASASRPRGRIPQIAPTRRGTRPTGVAPSARAQAPRPSASSARVAPAPAAAPSAQTAQPAPAAQPAQPAQAAPSSASNRMAAGAPDIPQIAPRPADVHSANSDSKFPFPLAIGACAALLVVLIAFFALRGGKTEQPQATASADSPSVQPPPATTKAVTPVTLKTPTSAVVAPKKVPQTAPPNAAGAKGPAKPDDTPARIGLASATLKNPPPATAAIEAAKPDPKPPEQPVTDLTAIIARTPSKSKVAPVEEEEPTPPPKKPESTAEKKVPGAVEKKVPDAAKTAPDAAKTPPDAEKKALDPDPNAAPPAAAPDPKTDAPPELDKDGQPKKRRGMLDLIGGDAGTPAKQEIDDKKKENPFAPKIVPVTATEPTVMPLEIDRIGGNDKTMTEQLVAFLPDWRIRDANMTTSKIGTPYMGREQAIVLNPMNDVLPAKILCTFELPKSFANARPTLLFEVSSDMKGRDWALAVRAAGFEILPKMKIKQTKDAPWQDVFVPLKALADRHFELQIEVYSTVKQAKLIPGVLGYIRNVRIEWDGKKK